MPKFFIKNNQIIENKINLIGEDVKHIANVLRMKINDEIEICNMDTSDNFLCKIKEISKENIKCEIINKIENNTELNTEITIFQGLPKAEKMEIIIQKCTEIGAKEFIPIEMERCVVKLDAKNEAKKIERWQKIAEASAKQSGRNVIPEIKNVINLKKVCNLIEKYDIVLVAYEKEEKNTLKNELDKLKDISFLKIGVIIGPEGGIEQSEVELLKSHGAKVITLGKRILRTETVGIYLTSIISYELN